ncbi:uncharacterized protein [Ptychodera flava]|uniref:uncharacterized protein n=1 Tax=Ptychodera flava TaxID=63121 RepID=UPI003969CC46
MIEHEDFIFTPNDEFCEHGILGTLESQDDIEISRNTIEFIPKHEEKTKAEAMKTCKHSEKVTELKKALYDERQKIQDLMKELEESNNQLQTCQSLKDEVQLLREELGIERSEKQKKEEEYASLIHQLENSDVLQVERQATGDIAAQQRFPNPFEDEERELRQQHFDGNQDQTDKLSGTVCMTNVGVTRPHSAAALFQQPIRPLGHPMFPGRQLVLSSPSPTNTTGRLPPPLEPEVLSSARQAAVRNSGRLRNTGTVRNQTILREALDDETIIEDSYVGVLGSNKAPHVYIVQFDWQLDRDDGLKEFHDAPEYPAESAMKWCQECHLLFPPSCPQDTFDQHVESHFGRVCPMYDSNKQVVVSDENGHVIRCFGQNELKDPGGIGISPVDGNVYVTERGGDCVRVNLHTTWQISISFGSRGKGQGQLNCSWGVVISSAGMVFVADYNNQCIQVFNAEDQYLYSFDCQSGDGKMRY